MIIPNLGQQQQRRSTVVTTQNWYFGSLTELLNSTYAVFPQSLRLVGSFNIGSPLPSIVIKYTQLNWATAGIAKLPISIKISRGERVNKFGDDACFTLNARRRDYIGIADGVGGWRQRGYDPSAFSTSLMTIAKDIGNNYSFIFRKRHHVLFSSTKNTDRSVRVNGSLV